MKKEFRREDLFQRTIPKAFKILLVLFSIFFTIQLTILERILAKI